MKSIFEITVIGLLAGVLGTGIGGLSAYILKKPSKRLFSLILGISGGLMISIVCFDLLPESFNMVGLTLGIFGIIFGVILISLLDEILIRKNTKDQDNYIKTGILIGVGILIHNFPEGLAIGSGYMATTKLGISLAIVIAIHNIPEGIAMAAPLTIGGVKESKILLYTIIAGLPMGLGAYLGALLGGISQAFIGWCLAFAGGAMLFITCQEILPKSRDMWKGRLPSLGIIFGMIVGILLSILL